jgi:hypothetical protein
MRQEQIIAAVARVVTTAIREMQAVGLFTFALGLHLWSGRMSHHQMSLSTLPLSGQPGRGYLGDPGSKRGDWTANPRWDAASCRVGSSSV